jgi:hypothetical protein
MIIWIASYPKSGNTWLRSLLSSYFFSKDGIFSFKQLENIKQFSSQSLISTEINQSNYQSVVSKNWIPMQEIINKDKKIHFLKTHNALCTINNNKFTDKLNTAACIYIVRDPRNLITSLSHHYELDYENAIKFITNKRKVIFPKTLNNKKDNCRDFNFISDWPGHYNSWKNISFCPIKIIKYEDLLADTKNIFISILKFISKFTKLDFNEEKISNALKTTNFDNLRRIEKEENFEESIISTKTNKKVKFFNLGKDNDWRRLLGKSTILRIEEKFKKEMNELNYI